MKQGATDCHGELGRTGRHQIQKASQKPIRSWQVTDSNSSLEPSDSSAQELINPCHSHFIQSCGQALQDTWTVTGVCSNEKRSRRVASVLFICDTQQGSHKPIRCSSDTADPGPRVRCSIATGCTENVSILIGY